MPRSAGLKFFVILSGVMAVGAVVSELNHLGTAVTLSTAISSAGLYGLYIAWATYRFTANPPVKLAIDQLAAKLADDIEHQWNDEIRVRGLDNPHLLPVSWQPAAKELVDSWDDIRTTAGAWPRGDQQASSGRTVIWNRLGGSGNQIGDVFRRVPTRRLIVLGPPGAGKTVLLIRLVLDLIARRKVSGGPVPVLLPLASWDPDEPLRNWIIDRLLVAYPQLKNPSMPDGRDVATALLDHGLLLPVLDGLDEIAHEVRGKAIAAINQALKPGEGIVLSSRIDEYRHAVNVPIRLNGAAGISLDELTSADVTKYLRRSGGPKRWDPVLRELGTKPQLAQVLRSPLMLTLADAIYNPHPMESAGTPPSPDELLNFSSASALRSHLFDAFIDTAYRKQRNAKGIQWKKKNTERWLCFLAYHLKHNRNGAGELKWWELRYAVPAGVPQAAVGTVCGISSGLAAIFGTHVGVGIGIGLGSGTLIGLAVSSPFRRARVAPRYNDAIHGIGGGLAGGAVGGLASGVAGKFGLGYAPWPFGGLAVALGVGIAVGPSSGLVGGLLGCLAGGFAAGVLSGVGKGTIAGLVNAIGVGLATGIIVAGTGRSEPASRRHWSPFGVPSGCAIGLTVGLIIGHVAGAPAGIVLGAVVGVISCWACGLVATEIRHTGAASPRTSLTNDAHAFALAGLAAGLIGFLAGLFGGGFASVHSVNSGATFTAILIRSIGTGVASGLIIGLVFAFYHGTWGCYTIARFCLALDGQLPWRLMTFLTDAHEQRGVLLQFNASYKFRHDALQDRLAQAYEDNGYASKRRSARVADFAAKLRIKRKPSHSG